MKRITAVFFCNLANPCWIKFQYADQSRSRPRVTETGTIAQIGMEVSTEVWSAVVAAIKTPNVWTVVAT